MNAVQDVPALKRPGAINLQDLKNAQQLARRFDPRLMPPDRITEIRATTRELNTVLKGAMASIPNVVTTVKVARFGILIGMSVELPDNPLGRYLNIRTVIASSSRGLRFYRLYVGKVEIPQQLIDPALRYALDEIVGKGKADPILKSVRSVKVLGPTIYVRFQPPPNLLKDIKTAARKRIQISSPKTVKPYYDLIEKLAAQYSSLSRVSLTDFIRPLFKLAGQRSSSGDPIDENRAAILALVLYFGDSRFERFIGEVRTAQQKSKRGKISHVRLNDRHDFVQHFAISAGLTLTGGEDTANIIGVLKEVKDAANKKSGFSFTDIGADRMGVRFAKKATENRSKALEFQRVLSAASSERSFFPTFTDLPQGMTTAQFKSRYRDTKSKKYRDEIAKIDRRIDAIGMYR
ncbi:MAG: hypothetical protein ACPGPC_08980 [Alphaproteobacteria bacterium]